MYKRPEVNGEAREGVTKVSRIRGIDITDFRKKLASDIAGQIDYVRTLLLLQLLLQRPRTENAVALAGVSFCTPSTSIRTASERCLA